MFSHGDSDDFAVLWVRNVENLPRLVLAECEEIVSRDIVVNQNLAQVLDLLHDVQLPTFREIDAFDLLVEIVIALVDFSLLTDELDNLQFLNLLLIIGIQNLYLVSLVNKEVLHD